MDDWIVVLDDDAKSQQQLIACQTLKPELKGAIQCDKDENAFADVCFQVDSFPAFCHAPTNKCVYGLRQTQDEFDELKTITTTRQK